MKFLDEDQNENVVKCSEEKEHDTFHNHCTSINENLTVAPGQGKSSISVFNDKFWEKRVFLYLFPDGKFGYKVERDIPIFPVP